ncbi:MAG: hypothetical protein FJ148_22940 [Deltaproteobacteria bacterium]|nr:hypothetical protein [Deltaproteobacteria bacterium]
MAGFRLDRLLRLRGQLRVLRQLELQQAEEARLRLLHERRALDAARRQALEDTVHATARGELDRARLHLAGAWEAALDARIQRVDESTVAASTRVAQQRDVVAAERREERKLEHLADRYRERLANEMALAAERMLDELTMSRHARENGERDRG